jgi:hypothetical protein
MTGCPCGGRCICHGAGAYRPVCRIDGVLVPGGCGTVRADLAGAVPGGVVPVGGVSPEQAAGWACLGPCNRGWREAWARHEADVVAWQVQHAAWQALADAGQVGPEHAPLAPDRPVVQPTPGEPLWCMSCAGALRRALLDLDDLAALVAAESDGHRGQALGAASTAPKSHRTPSPAAHLVDELYGVLTRIETDWRAARGFPHRPQRSTPAGAAMPRPRGATPRTLCIGWLAEQLPDMLHDPWSAVVARNIFAWRVRLQAAARARPEAIIRVRCPRCDQRAMRRRDDGYAVCGGLFQGRPCGRLASPEEIDALATAQAAPPAGKAVSPGASTTPSASSG